MATSNRESTLTPTIITIVSMFLLASLSKNKKHLFPDVFSYSFPVTRKRRRSYETNPDWPQESSLLSSFPVKFCF